MFLHLKSLKTFFPLSYDSKLINDCFEALKNLSREGKEVVSFNLLIDVAHSYGETPFCNKSDFFNTEKKRMLP